MLTEDNGTINWKEKNSIQKRKWVFVWNLQKKGIDRNIWFTVKGKNAIILIEEENDIKVRNIIESLSLIKERLITYNIIKLEAYDGYERLFTLSEMKDN